ncbi:MAG: phosphoglucosamine mutase, partial [Pseudomonadota bacterium]|nr:phosphoglucosamine mutase [Pseudomonadota bacterium]
MTRKHFGTDGIRGRANGVITPELALKVGQAAGLLFQRGDYRHRVVIGKDTRLSGYMIESALQAGFTSVGMDVLLLGPMPTPAVAMLTRSMRGDIGVMISASHNPYEDNGIKIFGPDGFKLSDEVEREIESLMDSDLSRRLADSAHLGRAKRIESVHARYIEFAKLTLPRQLDLEGMRVVVDCANGAAYKVAPETLWELGAEVIAIGVEPDGFNINRDVGSTSPSALVKKVREVRADIGIALDGDADRVLVIDEKGQLVDGDQLMAVVARSWREDGRLKQPGVVATVMSNLGLERYLGGLGLQLVRTAVGDRYVLEHMREHGYNLGGEQSGHIIMSDYTTTGDGLLAALQILAVVVRSGKPVSEVCHRFEPLP